MVNNCPAARARIFLKFRPICIDRATGDERCGNGNLKEWYETMTDDPVDLDGHRDMAAQKATEIRRRLHEVQADQTALRHRQEELESLLRAAPAKTWPKAAAKAQNLLQLFAATPEAQDLCRKELIVHTLDDLTRLCDRAKKHS